MLVLFDEEARRLGQKEQSNADDDRPSELDRDWDPVRPRIIAVPCRIVDNGRKKQSNGDSKLICSNNSASDPFG